MVYTGIENIFNTNDKILKKIIQSKKINSLINKEEVEKLLNSKKLSNSQSHFIFNFEFCNFRKILWKNVKNLLVIEEGAPDRVDRTRNKNINFKFNLYTLSIRKFL